MAERREAIFAGRDFDYVLTVCDNAKESCPVYFDRATRLHHSFGDPAAVEGSEEKRLGAFRKVRDELRAYLKGFPSDHDLRKEKREQGN